MTIDKGPFVDECVDEALFFGVNPHYVATVAKIRSEINDDTKDGRVGPYRLTQTEWDQNRTDAEFEMSMTSTQINEWERQVAVFASMTYRAQTRLQLNRYPTVIELYRETWPNDPQPDAATWTSNLADLAPLIGPAADALLEQKWVPDPTSADPHAPIPEPPTPAKGPKGTPDSPNVVRPGGPLGELIARGEGKYTSFNRGNAGGGGNLDFSLMTIAAVMARQALPAGNANRLFAVGKYQLIPSTMRSAVASLALNTQSLLTHSVQEALFRKYLVAVKRPQVKAFITGAGASMASAQMSLALEFASVARPDAAKASRVANTGSTA